MKRELTAIIVFTLIVASVPHALADDTGMASSHSWRNEGNKTCFEEHSHAGDGEGRTKRAAKKAAIRVWREFTAWEYGTDWAYYRRASGKIVSYTKAVVGWSARIEARPCRLTKRRRTRSRRRKSS